MLIQRISTTTANTAPYIEKSNGFNKNQKLNLIRNYFQNFLWFLLSICTCHSYWNEHLPEPENNVFDLLKMHNFQLPIPTPSNPSRFKWNWRISVQYVIIQFSLKSYKKNGYEFLSDFLWFEYFDGLIV